MEARYLDVLSDDVRIMVQEIEQICGIDIGIEVDPARARGLGHDPLACHVQPDAVHHRSSA